MLQCYIVLLLLFHGIVTVIAYYSVTFKHHNIAPIFFSF